MTTVLAYRGKSSLANDADESLTQLIVTGVQRETDFRLSVGILATEEFYYSTCWKSAMDLDGHTAVVTGAGRGIGRAIALELAKRGADITIANLRSEEMEETKNLIEDCGRDAAVVTTDIRDESNVDACVERTVERFESIEILVNNAGIAGPNLPSENVPVAEWDETLAVNLRGAFLMCRGVLPIMKDNEYGRIVNISSVIGKRPVAKCTPYAASKLGLIGLTRPWRQRLATTTLT